MIFNPKRGNTIIYFSLFVALILSIIQIPNWAQGLRPEWMPLVVIFWTLYYPERISLGTAWIFGFILDLFRDGAIAGQYALAMLVTSYITIKLHRRFLIYPLWQQVLTILLLILVYQLILFIVKGMGGTLHQSGIRFWVTCLTSAVVWPLVFVILTGVKNRIRFVS